MNNTVKRPSYQAYKKRQTSKKFPHIIKCDNEGSVFVVIDGEAKRKNYDAMGFAILLIYILSNIALDMLRIVDIPTLISISGLIILTAFIILIRRRILYTISKFEIIDIEDLEPAVKQSLEENEKVKSRK